MSEYHMSDYVLATHEDALANHRGAPLLDVSPHSCLNSDWMLLFPWILPTNHSTSVLVTSLQIQVIGVMYKIPITKMPKYYNHQSF